MNIQEQIDEILEFLKADCSYAAITGTIFKDDIDVSQYEREEVEDQSFDHFYLIQKGCAAIEDYFHGTTLIPIGNDVYVQCEWSS
jgi:hypothetical protein